ncbi:MAG: hypothetical protein JW966_01755 [Anaerolineae bacterium]|nr:hypothetical protein [Anaerolineae bacterium]
MLPQYPLSDDDLRNQPAKADTVNVPSEMSFAQEVRSERLDIIWKVTLFGTLVIGWLIIVITGGRDSTFDNVITDALIPMTLGTIGCIVTGYLLKHQKFEPAVWAYAVGITATTVVMLSYGSVFEKEYVAYVFPLVVFIVGVMLPVRSTALLLVLVLASVIIAPTVAAGDFVLPSSTFFALVLTTVAAAFSAQVSGELYGIAEWALESYRKERRTTFALFESQQALEKSLVRQRALTHQVQETNKELDRARRAAEEAKTFRGQFLANMSHELRTPLNAIIGFSQTMLDFPAMYDGVDLPSQYRQDMTQILNSGKHLLHIINDILDLSKVDAGKLDLEIQPVDLNPIVKGVLSTAIGLVGDRSAQVDLLRDLPDPLPMVMGDPLRVRQVLLNFYSNASKFTDSGYIKLIVRRDGQKVVFGVEDTGIGIAEEDKLSIFEEFRQGTAGRKKGRQGAGLGLAISQQLLRLMDGQLWFDSTLGKGSTFYFTLPVYAPDEEPVEDAPKAVKPVISTRIKPPAHITQAQAEMSTKAQQLAQPADDGGQPPDQPIAVESAVKAEEPAPATSS